ncbi:dolichyl-diphospho-oligosaccharide-protein epsilon unit [Cryptosporidium ubiquitum]|uniref:Dolichyl-diphosphooligosaccharide--protein glycosyltransferase subunit OST2 n=1 Tax=Cryptosporidium ubiquitum TaxID=857276 RepID=A0A1J4MPL0_9CRYT|nr:dolichyl-diphospho-oligosaccharide-protein epsilon unit [Cryptosporidium ubiquitum]OII75395.1 dolichyl-diphospho-oligosaccharide-protein epsilon unit [Cryptosporidium ubiquitum]
MKKTNKTSGSEASSPKTPTANNVLDVFQEMKQAYLLKVPENIQVLDSFILFMVIISIIQVVYCLLIQTTYPLDSLIGGVFCTIGTALLVLALRIQLTCPSYFGNISPKTAFTDFVICCIVFFIGCASVLI